MYGLLTSQGCFKLIMPYHVKGHLTEDLKDDLS